MPSKFDRDSYELLAFTEENEIFIYVTDHLGAPLFLFDINGNVVWYAQYEIYGETNNIIETRKNNLRFIGHYLDEETGFHYNRFRYYDPKSGLYITPDPFFLKDLFRPHIFANANPTSYTDPSGLMARRSGRWFPANHPSPSQPRAAGEPQEHWRNSEVPQHERGTILDQHGVPYRPGEILDSSHGPSGILATRSQAFQEANITRGTMPANFAPGSWNRGPRRDIEIYGINAIEEYFGNLNTKEVLRNLKNHFIDIVLLESMGDNAEKMIEAIKKHLKKWDVRMWIEI